MIPEASLAGKTVGEYRLVRQLGRGGMGMVFEGVQPLIGKRVAVKFLLPQLSADEKLVRQFVVEAKAVNAIAHRGIVDVFSFGHFEGMQYFVMEYLDGRAFDRLIATDAPLPESKVTRLLGEVVEALAAAHRAGVIHRDVKPSNVFLVEPPGLAPYVKLLDFGIAKTEVDPSDPSPISRQSLVVGTPEYIAPEQAQGKSIGPWTDLYSVGCVAFELLTGKLPFHGENPLETMFRHVTDPTPRVSEHRPVSPELDALVYALMAKDPAARPASAASVLEALRGMKERAPAEALPSDPAVASRAPAPALTSPAPASARAPERREARWRTPLAVGVALAAAGVVALYSRFPGRSSEVAAPAGALSSPTMNAASAVTPAAPGPAQIAPAPEATTDVPPARVNTPGVTLAAPSRQPLPGAEGKSAGPAATERAVARPVPEQGHRAATPPTARALQARVQALDAELVRREKARGERLQVVRGLLDQAKQEEQRASTPKARSEVSSTLDAIEAQLNR